MGGADFPFVQVLGQCDSGRDASVIDKIYFLIRTKHLQTSPCFYSIIMLLLSVILSISSQLLLLVLPVISDPLYYKGFPIYFKNPYHNSDSKYTSLLSLKDNTEEDEDDISTSQSNDIFSEEALKQEFQQQGAMPVADTPVLTTDVVQKGFFDPSYYNNYAQYLMEAYRPSESINTLNKQFATTNFQNFYYPEIKTNFPIKNNANSHKTTTSPSKLTKNYKVKPVETKEKVRIPDYNKFSKDGGDNRKFLNLFKGFFKGGTHDNFKVYKVHKKPYPYNFGYKVNDYYGNSQWRNEIGDKAGAKRGSYGYVDAHGVRREVHYVADHKGFRAWIKTNEPGTANSNPASVLITHQTPPLITNYAKKPAYFPTQNFKLPLLKLPMLG